LIVATVSASPPEPLAPPAVDARAWGVLCVLSFVYVLNFLDRQLLAILAKPIQDSLHITDGQLGLIGGLYFAFFYCFIAVPVGWFADRTRRVTVLSLACAIWSGATMACGIAGSYPQLVAARMTVGFGEAGGVPPSYALITDLFPPGRRGTALGIYNLGPPIGAALGIAFGASVAAAFDWRYAFITIGVVGLLTAAVVRLLVHEPVRGRFDGNVAHVAKPGFTETLRMFFSRRTLVLAALGSGATQFITYGLGNFTTLYLMREKGMTLREVAVWYALVAGIGMSAGMVVSGRVIDRLTRRSKAAYATVPALSLALALPCYVAFVWAPTWRLALVFLTGAMMLNYFYLSASVTLVQEEVRPDQRVMSGALLLLVMNFVGLGLGPTYVGAASDWFAAHGVSHPLQVALYTLTPFYGIAILIFLWLARTLRRDEASRTMTIGPLVAMTAACFALPSPADATPRAAMSPARVTADTEVAAPAGAVRGTTEGHLHVFRGIPYAQPPVGPLRWQPPLPLPRWNGVRDATRFGPGCYQPAPQLSNIYAGNPMPLSEDCLTLNIWAPAGAKKAAVFFWIYGGALQTGASREPMYDGARLAERGVVVVSINYRLGVLGWLALPELSAESPHGVSGNYGLLDQIRALTWVKDNIAAFGGDPDNVTIAGESAGALSVMYLFCSPLARGLFARGILESAYMISTPALKTAVHGAPSAEQAGLTLMHQLKQPDLAAMRAMPAEQITAAAVSFRYGPWGAIDGYVLPDQLVNVFDEGRQALVPLLAGFNSGEIRSLKPLAPPVPASTAEYERTIRERYGDLADAFLTLYPSTNMQESIFATTRDALYGWTAERLVRKQTALGVPAFLYLWDHGYPAAEQAGLHAFHASELPYVFDTFRGTPPLWPKNPDTPEEHALADAVGDYWTSFARTGHPQARNAPDWPAFAAGDSYMRFAATPILDRNLMPGMYDLNETVMCRRRANGTLPWGWMVGVAAPKMPTGAAGC
jgi:para-nitrobenzyl esterase